MLPPNRDLDSPLARGEQTYGRRSNRIGLVEDRLAHWVFIFPSAGGSRRTRAGIPGQGAMPLAATGLQSARTSAPVRQVHRP